MRREQLRGIKQTSLYCVVIDFLREGENERVRKEKTGGSMSILIYPHRMNIEKQKGWRSAGNLPASNFFG